MKIATKIFCLLLIIAILSSCIVCFMGCDSIKDSLKVLVNGEEQSINLSQKNDNTWYTDIQVADNSKVTLYDSKGKKHTTTVSEGGKYTFLLNNVDGKYKIEARKQKRAVLWVTALLSGGLYDQEDGTQVWDPLPYEDILLKNFLKPEDMEKTISELVVRLLLGTDPSFTLASFLNPIVWGYQDKTNFLWNMSFDHNGIPNNPNIVAANGYDGKIQYGVLGAYMDHNNEINEHFKDDDIEFHVFNYDWRKDCSLAADTLSQYIEDNKYTDVILFSHSMGGNVVASYLAKNEYNRSRVAGYVSMSGAFLGSFDALYTMEDLEGYFGSAVSGFGIQDIMDGLGDLKNLINFKLIFSSLQDFIVSLDTFVQLLPTYELITSKQYGDDGDGDAFTIDGVAINSKDDLYAFYESRPWAWKKDENGEYIMDGEKHVLRDVVKNLRAFHDSCYVTNDKGERVFSTTLVDTYYVVGNDQITLCGADLDTQTNKITFRTTKNGDTQVLHYSLLANLDENELQKKGKLITYDGRNHFQVGCDWELIREQVLGNIKDIFNISEK